MRRRIGHALVDGRLFALHDRFGDFLHPVDQPHVRRRVRRVVRFAVHVDPAVLAQLIDLLEFFQFSFRIDGERAAAMLPQNGERRHVAWAVSDIDHLIERHPTVVVGHERVDVDGGFFVGAFVDFEYRPRLRRVVHRVADLGDDPLLFGRIPVLFHVFLDIQIALYDILDELAAPDAVDEGHNLRTPDHIRQAGADDVVLHFDGIRFESLVFFDDSFGFTEKLGHAGIERQLAAELPQFPVVQSRKDALLHAGEHVIQVDGVPVDADVRVPPFVFSLEVVHFLPKFFTVHVVVVEDRLLHVVGNEGFIEVPDDGDDGLVEGVGQ